MHNELLKIKKAIISGIKNPILVVKGVQYVEDLEFKFYEENNEIGYIKDLNPSIKDNEFVLEVLLTNSSNFISMYSVYKGEERLLFKKRNSLLLRIFHKIVYKIKNFFLFFPYMIVDVLKTIKRYHFMVPTKVWPILIKDLRLRPYVSNPFNVKEYNKWIKKYEEKTVYEKLDYEPLISILIPVYNIGKEYLTKCLESILNGYYQNFEVCIVDDCSTNEETIKTLKEYESKDSRIKVKYRRKNGHISRSTNDALKMARGEFVALVDDDDELTEDALYRVVKELNTNKKLDMIYSDEDKIGIDGRRCDPNFKSDFAPDSLLSSNYICHFTVLRKKIVDDIGGFRVGFEGAQDYDLFLRFTEKTNNIFHIPKILYHWRMVPGSTSMVIDNKNYALERGKKALEDALDRRGIKGKVFIDNNCPYYKIEYDVINNPKVSIIIPTKDLSQILEKCLKSIYEKSTYKNYEVVVINNNSVENETFELFTKYKNEYKNFRVIDANIEFNYSKINNIAVSKTKSDYVVLLNNDIEVITPNWLEIMIGYASQEHIGCVGAKLLYPNNTIQHCGIVMGLGIASHVYSNYGRNDIVWSGRLSVPYNYMAVTAACLMVDRKKYLEVSGLEEELKVAYNDVDFNLKLFEKGYYNVSVPMVELYHYESISRGLDISKDKYIRFKKESNYMYRKWKEYILNDPFYNKNYTRRSFYKLDK